jgi:hypothetical protein
MGYYLLEEKIKAKLIKEQKREQKKKDNGNSRKIRHLTKKQRLWIHIRDGWRCRFNGCNSSAMLEIHHIVPSFYAKYILGWADQRINSPFNTITLCHFNHHIIHSVPKIECDIVVQEQRKKFLDERPCWDTSFDDELSKRAINLTELWLAKHPDDPFPIKEHKRNGEI